MACFLASLALAVAATAAEDNLLKLDNGTFCVEIDRAKGRLPHLLAKEIARHIGGALK